MKITKIGNSLGVQWLGPSTFTAVGPGSIPGQRTRILQGVRHGQKKKKKKQITKMNYSSP